MWSLAGLLLVAEGWGLQQTRERARRALTALTESRQEWSRQARLSPAPTVENERALELDLETVAAELTIARAAWAGAAAATTSSGDAYFDLAAFREEIRVLAARAQVATRAQEGFGFASHLHQGPAAELAPAVSRQRAVLHYLITTLIAAHPRALLAVRRERPRPEAERLQRRLPQGPRPSGSGSFLIPDQPEDYFEWTDQQSLRVPGQIAGDAFRLEFSGPTSVLRDFLNRLAAGDWPIVVRRVEAGPVEAPDAGLAPGPRTAPEGPAPLLKRNLTRFTVVAEFIELAAAIEKRPP